MRRRRPVATNVVFMPFPDIDDAFWADIHGEDDPRALSIALRAHKWMMRADGPDLTDKEFCLATWLLDRTVGSCRARYTGTYEDMRRGEYNMAGVRGSVAEIQCALESLVATGLVILHGTGPEGVTVSINLHWTPVADEPRSKKGRSSPRSPR
ncbi:MAG: hypothetical protein GX458_01255 [Phyllobacteriaceae bacterium]|nr:hypothetical protein [Phyllobacteriaceae bacterium]